MDPALLFCSQCGAEAPTAGGPSDWRALVRDTVRRRNEKRERERRQREEDVGQLSIFDADPQASTPDEEERSTKKRHDEIRARVEKRLSESTGRRRRRLVDVGEVAIQTSGAATAMVRAPDPDLEYRPSETAREPETAADRSSDMGEAPPTLLARPGERLLAGLIDVAVVAVLLLGLGYLTSNMIGRTLTELPGASLAALGCVGVFLGMGYFVFFWAISGQTFGALLTGVRVVDGRGRPPGFGRASARVLGSLVSILPLGAGFLGLWGDAARRGWHDRLAATRVVRS
jgi:uncharacterized RDD family membrane protein YckC